MNKLIQKYNNLSPQMKAAFWFTMCSFLQKGISFITVPIFTRIMSTEQYGTYSLYLSWLQLFTVLSTLYLYHGVTDNAMAKFEEDRSRFISSMQGLTISITTAVMLVTFALWHGVQEVLGLAPVMIMLMFAEIYVIPALAFWSARQRFDYKYRKLVLITLIKSILNPVLGIAAVSLSTDKPLARVVATVAVEIVICGTIMIIQFRRGKVFFDRDYWKYAFTLAIPMLPHYLAGIVLNHGDKIVISKVLGTSEVALYGVAYSIGFLVQIFVGAINNALTPWVYGRLKVSDIKSIKNRSRSVLFIVFCIAVALMLLSPELVAIFGSSEYADSVDVIPPVAASVFFVFLYGYLSFPEFYYEKTSFLMIASITAAVLNVVLNFIFVPIYGFVAAAYTTLVCYILYSLGHYIVGGVILKKHTSSRAIIDEPITLIISICLVAISSTVHLIFGYVAVRYCLIIIGCAVLIWKRKFLIKMFTEK